MGKDRSLFSFGRGQAFSRGDSFGVRLGWQAVHLGYQSKRQFLLACEGVRVPMAEGVTVPARDTFRDLFTAKDGPRGAARAVLEHVGIDVRACELAQGQPSDWCNRDYSLMPWQPMSLFAEMLSSAHKLRWRSAPSVVFSAEETLDALRFRAIAEKNGRSANTADLLQTFNRMLAGRVAGCPSTKRECEAGTPDFMLTVGMWLHVWGNHFGVLPPVDQVEPLVERLWAAWERVRIAA